MLIELEEHTPQSEWHLLCQVQFPGIGTVAQVAIEAGTISGDTLLMLRYMAAINYGIALIYGKKY